MLLVPAYRPMFSKLNPFHTRRPKPAKASSGSVSPTQLNPSFLKIWKRSPSAPAGTLPQVQKSPSVVTRSQVKRPTKLLSSHAMASTSTQRPKRLLASLDSDVQPYRPAQTGFLTPEYFMDVNLKLTNTNATSNISEVSVNSARLTN